MEETILEYYADQFFDQLASRQPQSVISGLCLTLSSIVSYSPAIRKRTQFLDFLSMLLSEKLASTTRKPEFIAMAAILSSISKILTIGKVVPRSDGNIFCRLIYTFRFLEILQLFSPNFVVRSRKNKSV